MFLVGFGTAVIFSSLAAVYIEECACFFIFLLNIIKNIENNLIYIKKVLLGIIRLYLA
jgi:hypothetical protein